MNPFKILRKIGKLIRGAAPTQIFLGALLGVVIGMIPGVNLTIIAAVFLLFMLNAHVGVAIGGFLLGRLAALLLAPVTFRIGTTIIHRVGLEETFRAASDAPVMALLDLHIYCLVGGLPIALALGTVLGIICVKIVNGIRLGILSAADHSEALRAMAKTRVARILLWVLFGGSKADLADVIQGRRSPIRKAGLILGVVALAIGASVEYLLLDRVLRTSVEKGLGAANGAEVNVARANLSMRAGELHLGDIEITNPEKPTHNRVRIGRAVARVSIRDLLRKRLIVDEITLADVETYTERATPG